MGEFIKKNGWLLALLLPLVGGSGLLSLRLGASVGTLVIIVVLLCGIGLLALFFVQRSKPKSPAVTVIRLVVGMMATFPGWPSLMKAVASFIGFKPPVQTLQTQLVFLAVFAVTCVTICVIAATMGRAPLERAKTGPASPFRERTYLERFKGVAEIMRRRLDGMDHDSNWTDRNFEPLDAEVEEISATGRKTRRVGDLLSAIKRDRKTRVFLIIGEPGSGKSTALRKLAKDLLEAAPRTEILPLYINLREWKGSILPSGEPPTAMDLFQFVSDQATRVNDLFVSEFFEEHLRAMIEHGRIFFIFDSFDEIPILLDKDESSTMIGEISQLVGNMTAGAGLARGVIASRLYRRPRLMATEFKHLEVRPFSESKIRSALLKSGLTEAKVNGFMRGPPRWIASARNPFVANLICQYLKTSARAAPESQVSLYETYIDGRLARLERDMAELRLTRGEVKDAASRIAQFMFRTEGVGLDATQRQLRAAGFSDEVLYVLVTARIIRQSAGPDRSVSFVHRRFYEYFLVQFLREEGQIDLTAIEEDRRERDALVLYAEIADDVNAENIVRHCWGFIKTAWTSADPAIEPTPEQVMKATYCLRFLVDAFSRTGSSALDEIETPLRGLLEAHIDKSIENPLTAKIAVEASGLFSDDVSAALIERALVIGEPWVAETAIRSCRYVTSSENSLRERAEQFVMNASDHSIVTLGRDFGGLFNAADILKPLKLLFQLRMIHIAARQYLFIFGVVISPVLSVISSITSWLMLLVFSTLKGDENRDYSLLKILPKRMFVFYFMFSIPTIIMLLYTKMTLIGRIGTGDRVRSDVVDPIVLISPVYAVINSVFLACFLSVVSIVLMSSFYEFLFVKNLIGIVGSIFSWALSIRNNPIHELRKNAKWIIKTLGKMLSKGFISRAFAIVVGASISSFLVYIVIYITELLDEKYTKYIITCVSILLSIFIFIVLFRAVWSDLRAAAKGLRAEWSDQRQFKSLGLREVQTREQVAGAFLTPLSVKGRCNVVAELGLRSRQEGWSPAGEWPSGRLPALGDMASSELARLEEQWRGLDR